MVHSKRPGMGKSLYVKRLSEKMSKRSSMKSHEVLCTIPIHGPDVTSDYVMSLLVKYLSKSQSKIFSICISPSVSSFSDLKSVLVNSTGFYCMYVYDLII